MRDFVLCLCGALSRAGSNHIVIWNEPNLAFEWGYRPPDPAAMPSCLRMAYARAKEANPEIQVLAAGLAPTWPRRAASGAWTISIYLQRMYDAGRGALVRWRWPSMPMA